MHPTELWWFVESHIAPEEINPPDVWAELYALLD